jgi:diacylglycerol kinase (ATP)
MKPFVIVNPAAGSAREVTLELFGRLPGAMLAIAGDGPDARRLASWAAASGDFDTVIAAGGDGTVSAVAASLAETGTRAALGILPLGTGNDLARTLAIPLEPEAAIEALRTGATRELDIIEIDGDDGTRTHAVNVAAGGFSGEVDEALTPERKQRWGPLAYVFTALEVAGDTRPFRVRLTVDGERVEELDALNVIVANGRTVGGGRAVAPRASLEDGLLDVVVVRSGGRLDLARIGARLIAGDYTGDDLVTLRRAVGLRVESDPPMPWNADGELISRAAVEFRVRPRALRALVGEGYRAELEDEDEDEDEDEPSAA